MAGRIPQTFIDEIVARADIVEIIGARVPLKKAGREYKACCPFHNEKTPSFWVSPEKQFYHCFGCGAHGTAIGFLMQYEKLEFPEAVAELAERAGLEIPREAQNPREAGGIDLYETVTQASLFFAQNLRDEERPRAYLAKRGIEAAAAAAFALGYAADSWNALLGRFGAGEQERRKLLQSGLIIERDDRGGGAQPGFYDRFRDRLMFPIRDARGRVLGFGGRVIDQGEPKYLNSPETPLFHKGRELYGLYEAKQAHADFKRLLIVEGYMDVVRLHQAGITYAVATLGTATTHEHLQKIFRMTSEVVFAFDGDRAGRAAAWRALEAALPMTSDGRELKFMFLPEGHDPDTLIAAEGAAAFESRLKSALPLSEYLLRELGAQVDLRHVDGRAKLAALARPLFARMPDGVYRELLADRLAAEIRMPAAKLKDLWVDGPGKRAAAGGAAAGREVRGPTEGRRRPASAGRGTLLSQAIGLVLQHPAAARSIADPGVLAGVQRPGAAVLKELLEHAAAADSPTTAVLLERWRERAEFARLTELAARPPLVATTEAAASELQKAVEKLLEEFGAGRRMNELLQKAEELGLNIDEKTELTALLKAKNRPLGNS
ncbi:MAG TPA: DNA primase [Steroidobacteraceae bacterium]|nr:DNA primase [Steroidobacteraceae bacterium]